MTRTLATLQVSKTTYDEIRSKLTDADYGHLFREDGLIDMEGLALALTAPQASPTQNSQEGTTSPPCSIEEAVAAETERCKEMARAFVRGAAQDVTAAVAAERERWMTALTPLCEEIEAGAEVDTRWEAVADVLRATPGKSGD